MKYVVMECHYSYVVLLDEDGRFLKAANLNYEVGQTVTDPVLVRTRKRSQYVTRMITRAIAFAAVIMLIVSGIGFYRAGTECYSSVLMSINPEVRIELNKWGDVIDVEGLNTDGVILIEGYESKGKKAVQVVGELVRLAAEKGYITDGETVSFAFDSEDNEVSRKNKETIIDEIDQHIYGMGITVNFDFDGQITPENDTTSGIQSTKPSTYIGTDKATNIALEHAGVSQENAVVEKAELDEEDGRHVYEIGFDANGKEYDYEIDAVTGEILKSEIDDEDD